MATFGVPLASFGIVLAVLAPRPYQPVDEIAVA
jgi:hypothetical protein